MADLLLSLGIDTSSLRTAWMRVQTEIAGLSSSSQFGAIIKPGSTGLVDQYGKAISQVAEETKKAGVAASAASGGFSSLLSRISIWAFAWTAMYSAVRQAVKEVINIGDSLAALNESINLVRASTDEMGSEFDEKFSKIKTKILEVTSKGTIALKEMAGAFRTLQFEGMNVDQATIALESVRSLATLTGEKVTNVATSVAEVYGLWSDKIKGAATEQEKFNIIANYMASAYTKAGVSTSEFYTLVSKVGVASKNLGLELGYVTKMIIYLDNSMVGSRQAASAVKALLFDIAGNTEKLNSTFGIASQETDSFQLKLDMLKNSLDNIGESEFTRRALKIFPDVQQAEIFIDLIRNQNALLSIQADQEVRIMEEAKNKAHEMAGAFNVARTQSVGFFDWIGQQTNKAVEENYQKDLAAAKMLFDNPNQERTVWNTADPTEKQRLLLIWEENKARELAKQKLEEYRQANNKSLEEEKSARAEIIRLREEFDYKKIDLTSKTKSDVADVERSNRLSVLESANVNERYITQEKINNLILQQVEARTDLTDKGKEALEADLQAAVATEDIYTATQMATAALGDQTAAVKFITELKKEQLALDKEMISEMMTFANQLQSTTQNFVKDMLDGNGDLNTFMTNLQDNYKSAFSEQITSQLADTGIFASMASSFMSPLQKGHYDGVKSAVPMIIQAHIDGIKQGMAGGATGGTATASATGTATKSNTIMDSLSTIFSSPTQQTAETSQGTVPVAADDYYLTGGDTSSANKAKLAAVGQLASQAMSAYTGISSLVEGYAGQGLVMGGLSGAMSGAMAGSMAGPWGMAIGAVVGGIWGAISGSQEQTSETIKESTIEITSAIEISNKELTAISRNIIGLRRDFEGYFMPNSAYFSASRVGVEERFALSSLQSSN